jgi:uncharacterized protein
MLGDEGSASARGSTIASDRVLRTFILKVASRCNLACPYCYVYFKGDATWKRRPPVMPDSVFDQTLERIQEYCTASGQSSVAITFHGGEPCLIGARRFDTWCSRAQQSLRSSTSVRFGIQTNGTLLDAEWAETLRRHGVRVGVSVDGPREIHDSRRPDHRGGGSYEAVERGLAVLRKTGVPFAILAVIPFGADPLFVHRHLMSLGAESIAYLLPDFTHETIGPIRARYGETPCADFLIPIFDDWTQGSLDVPVADLWNMSRVILGGPSQIEAIGNQPTGYAVIETNGDIESVDVLRICAEGMAGTGLNVRDAPFQELTRTGLLHRQAIFEGMTLPRVCRACPESRTCAGGYLPHRFSRENGFDNPSVWCADLLKLFGHFRGRLNVTVEETDRRRERLHRLAESASRAAVTAGSSP